MKPLVMDSDVLVHDCTFGPILYDLNKDLLKEDVQNWKEQVNKALADKHNQYRWNRIKGSALYTNHSNIQMAGEYAMEVRAKNLFLTHLSRKYDAEDPTVRSRIEYLFEEQAKMYFDGFVKTVFEGYKFFFYRVCYKQRSDWIGEILLSKCELKQTDLFINSC